MGRMETMSDKQKKPALLFAEEGRGAEAALQKILIEEMEATK